MEENNDSKIILSKKDEQVEEVNDESPIIEGSSFFDTSLVPMSIAEDQTDFVDPDIVNRKFYNNFNFSKLTTKYGNVNLTLGITSANRKEGKTLVASNMAVSLAKAYRQRTVLVDLNFQNPQLHKIFGTRLRPGLIEAMQTRSLQVSPTMVDDLYLLAAGDNSYYSPDIKDTIALREIFFTLKNEFDFVIVDMGSIFPIEDFPVHFFNEVDGLITVIDTQSTKEEHLTKMYKHIDEKHFIGYIFNRFDGID